jgi:hypothetical protein
MLVELSFVCHIVLGSMDPDERAINQPNATLEL